MNCYDQRADFAEKIFERLLRGFRADADHKV